VNENASVNQSVICTVVRIIDEDEIDTEWKWKCISMWVNYFANFGELDLI
jgi:hypothetical protein